jgi:hypothetical protein
MDPKQDLKPQNKIRNCQSLLTSIVAVNFSASFNNFEDIFSRLNRRSPAYAGFLTGNVSKLYLKGFLPNVTLNFPLERPMFKKVTFLFSATDLTENTHRHYKIYSVI